MDVPDGQDEEENCECNVECILHTALSACAYFKLPADE